MVHFFFLESHRFKIERKMQLKKVGKIRREARGHLLQFLLPFHFLEVRFK